MRSPSRAKNNAGSRNANVTIQVAVDGTANSMGEVSPVFQASRTRRAEILETSGREFIAAMAVQPMLNAIVKLPYDSFTKTITPRDRIVDNGKVYNIAEATNENRRNEKVVLWCVGVG